MNSTGHRVQRSVAAARGGAAVLNVPSLALFEGWGGTFSVLLPFWFPGVALVCWEGRQPGRKCQGLSRRLSACPGASSLSPSPCPAGWPQEPALVFSFLGGKQLDSRDSSALEFFFFLIYVKNYNLEELIKSYCHSKHGFIHCSVLALDKPGYPVNFPWMTGWCTVHQLSSFWVVIANADSQPPPGPSESECGGERPVNQYWYTVFPVRYVCVSKFENKFVAFHTYCNVKILVPTFFF